MAGFDIAKGTMNTIGLDCPIWLVGMGHVVGSYRAPSDLLSFSGIFLDIPPTIFKYWKEPWRFLKLA
jgi:hypothetical protein